jgi:Sulfotransferase domain
MTRDSHPRVKLRSRVERRLRQSLPRTAYQIMVGRYYSLRKIAGRNPGRGRLLPDFVIPGAAKAGTTSLYGWLSQHPFVRPASQKEVHYFDYSYYRGDDWYRSHFPLERDRIAFQAEHGRPFLTGEASPSYITHDWAPERLAGRLPEVKLLITLRNPVDRAYSQYQMTRREEQEPFESFMEAVEAEEARLAPELARTRVDRRYSSWWIGCWSYKMRSRYAEQLERWLELFPREQFHILTLEELASDPQGTLDRVHEFLGLPSHRYEDLEPLHTATYGAITPEVRSWLTEYFRPHNQRLYELVGRDLGWEHNSAPVRQ